MSEYTEGTINLDDIAGAGGFVKPGRYNVELVAVNPIQESKTSKLPMVDAVFEIQGGDYDGTAVTKHFSLGIWPPKKDGGKSFAPGISELKATLASVHAPKLELPYKGATHKGNAIKVADPVKAAKALGTALRGKTIGLAVIPTTRKNKETGEIEKNDDGSDRTFYDFKLLGPTTNGATTATDGESLGL